MVYDNCKIYGPYLRKDGRQHMCLVYPSGKRTVVSYPKYLMEKYLGRYLKKEETVHHIDHDFTNNELSNLKILDKITHARLDIKRLKSIEVKCTMCGKLFVIDARQQNDKNRYGSGYFCSRECGGRYGAEIQNGKRNKITGIKKIKKYYRLSDRRSGEIGSTRGS